MRGACLLCVERYTKYCNYLRNRQHSHVRFITSCTYRTAVTMLSLLYTCKHRWKSAYKIWSKLHTHPSRPYRNIFSLLLFFFFCSSTWHNSATLHLYINFCVLFTHLLLLIHMVILYEYSTYNISFFFSSFSLFRNGQHVRTQNVGRRCGGRLTG